MREANEQEELTRLSDENKTLNAECDRLEGESKRGEAERQRQSEQISALRRQLTSAQQQIASLSSKLADLTAEGTEELIPIGPHHFDATKIAAVHWEEDHIPGPVLCIDRVPAWWPPVSRPEAHHRDRYQTEEEHQKAHAYLQEWEQLCKRAEAAILGQITRARRALAERRRRAGKTKKRASEAAPMADPKATSAAGDSNPAQSPRKGRGERRPGKVHKISR